MLRDVAGWRTRFPDADSLRVATIHTGVTHTFAWYAQGPWAIHVVEIDARRCAPLLEARKPRPDLAARATTTSLSASAIVGINADFFRLPGGTPVGAHVSGGVPLIGPTDRQVFAAAPDAWWIGSARLDGAAHHATDSAALVQVNRAAAPFSGFTGTIDGITLFTAWIGDAVPADSAARRVRLRTITGDESAGTGIVITSDSVAAPTALSPNEVVMLAHGTARDWARRRAPGDTVRWHAALLIPVGNRTVPAHEVVGGFPQLLRAGEDVLHEQVVRTEFGEQRHPRTALGWSTDRHRLLFVVVDGRAQGYSDGMSLPELTWLFRRLGASDALNLDGGGSTALVVHGTLSNRPSDREGERLVGNALVLTGCR